MLNHITIMGRLTRDPELRRTQSGTPVCTFTVAVDRDYQAKEAQEKQTDFIDCVAWRSTAEFVCKYFTKGRMIVVDGSLQSRKWTDKTGQNRVSWEIQANNLYFGDSRRDAQNQGGDYAPSYGSNQSYGSTPSYGAAPSYSSGSSYNNNSAAPAYGSPAESYGAPSGGGFSELEEEGELPF